MEVATYLMIFLISCSCIYYFYTVSRKKKITIMLLDSIIYNRDIIEKTEKKTKREAEYLAICALLDDLHKRPKGDQGRVSVIQLVQNYFPHHFNDVLTYISWKTGLFAFKPEFEEKLIARHAISD